MAAPVVSRHGRADAAGESVADAEPGQGDPAVHRAAVSGYNALTQGAGLPQHARAPCELAKFFKTAQAGDRLPTSRRSGASRSSGATTASRAASSGRTRMRGSSAWSGARPDADGDNIVWGTLRRSSATTSSGAPRRRQRRAGARGHRRQPRVGHVRDASGDNIVWGTHCGRRQPRVGHDCRRRQHRVGHRLRRSRLRQPRLGHARDRDGDNIVWGTGRRRRQPRVGHHGEVDNLVWGTATDDDNLTWGNSGEDAPMFDDPVVEPVAFDPTVSGRPVRGPRRSIRFPSDDPGGRTHSSRRRHGRDPGRSLIMEKMPYRDRRDVTGRQRSHRRRDKRRRRPTGGRRCRC